MNVETLLDSLDNVQAVDTQIETEVSLDAGAPGGALLKVIGFDGQTQQIDLVHAEDGRLPEGRDEVLVSDGVAPIGTTVAVTGQDGETTDLTVVGIGGTSFWSATSAAFTTLETARDMAGLEGVNRIVISADDVGKDELRATADSARDLLAQEDVAMTFLPITIANNEHPVEADIEQVSSLIGILGIVAGIVVRPEHILVPPPAGEPAALLDLLVSQVRQLARLAIDEALGLDRLGLPGCPRGRDRPESHTDGQQNEHLHVSLTLHDLGTPAYCLSGTGAPSDTIGLLYPTPALRESLRHAGKLSGH